MTHDTPTGQQRQNALERIQRAAEGSSSLLVIYAAAAAQAYAISGADLAAIALISPFLARLVEKIGSDVLANIVDRVAHGHPLSFGQIRGLLEKTLADTILDEFFTEREFQMVVSRLQSQDKEEYSILARKLDRILVLLPSLLLPSPPLQRPPRATHFIGRQDELARLLAQLQPDQVVTLCGPGGIGKTALAAEAIWALAPDDHPPQRFPDGIIFHNFYNQPQADLALEAIARAYRDDPKPTPRDAARLNLAHRVALLVLDGTEKAEDLGAVLAVRGRCGVLITTRRHQDVPTDGQEVRPLPNPQAVELLQAWGGDRAADQAAAERICHLVGGLPLALRLTGRYLAHRPEEASDYLAWLEETPLTALHHGDRQRETVPVLIERSLEPVSQAACGAMSVVGLLALAPFSREAVAAALEISPQQAGRALGELVDYGLLLRNATYYQASHPLVHTYARRRLAPPPDHIARLAAYYDAFAAQQRDLGLPGYATLPAERPHLLAVLDKCVDSQHWEEVRSLAWAIHDYLDFQGHWTQRATAIQAGLNAARQLSDPWYESRFLNLLGLAYLDAGQVALAIEQYQAAVAIAQEIGDRRGEGNSLGNLGTAYRRLGQWMRAIEYYQDALAIAQEIGDRGEQGNSLGNLGIAYYCLDQWERAIEHHEAALAIAREICATSMQGSPEWTAARRGEEKHLGNLGTAYRCLGQLMRAIEYHQEARTIAREIGDWRGERTHVGNLGYAYHDLGHIVRAIEPNEAKLASSREICAASMQGSLKWAAARSWESVALSTLGNLYHNLGQVAQAIEYHQEALVISREIGNRSSEGTILANLGNAYRTLGQVERAIEHYEAALAIAREICEASKQGSPAFGQARFVERSRLCSLGLAYRALGQVERARDYLTQALAIFEEIKSPTAERVRGWLADLEHDS